MSCRILILYYSRGGNTKAMVQAVAKGVEKVTGAEAVIRTVPSVSADTQTTQPDIPVSGDLYASHEDLEACGFGGCVAYSCAGAGQRVTQDLFDGETWRDDPDLLTHMTRALRVLRPIHEALLVLQEAAALPLPEDLQARCSELTRALCPENPASVWDFEDDSVQEALASLPDFVESLAPFAQDGC